MAASMNLMPGCPRPPSLPPSVSPRQPTPRRGTSATAIPAARIELHAVKIAAMIRTPPLADTLAARKTEINRVSSPTFAKKLRGIITRVRGVLTGVSEVNSIFPLQVSLQSVKSRGSGGGALPSPTLGRLLFLERRYLNTGKMPVWFSLAKLEGYVAHVCVGKWSCRLFRAPRWRRHRVDAADHSCSP